MVDKFEIETDDWTIVSGGTLDENCFDGYIQPIFRSKNPKNSGRAITQEDLDSLLRDLEDFGKWRKFKELKQELNENGSQKKEG